MAPQSGFKIHRQSQPKPEIEGTKWWLVTANKLENNMRPNNETIIKMGMEKIQKNIKK